MTPEEIARTRAELNQQVEEVLSRPIQPSFDESMVQWRMKNGYSPEEARRATEGTPEYIRAENEREAERRRNSFELERLDRDLRRFAEEKNSRRADERRIAEAQRRAELEARGLYEYPDPDPVLQLNDPSRLLELPSRVFSSEGGNALYRTFADPISELYRKAFPRGPIFVR